MLWKLYKYNILQGINSILLVLIISSLFFSLGVCSTGQCAYIEETDRLTQQVLTTPPQEYVMANKVINNITIPLALLYGITTLLLFVEKKKRKEALPEQAKQILESFMGMNKK